MKLSIKQWTFTLEIILVVARRNPPPPPVMPPVSLIHKPSNVVPLRLLN